ncbi:structural maintenance of chromosomes protein 5 [Episyrphus balteatus]|uniref:structural maintenance of chromosomes protein 5 n=1 Tax=Episyrphus balteatus TaxID=286459 RepID=UPI002486C883|nr:structural maintenance of chromosomes protein 5 [Episyrphus balteatus]
MEVDDEIDERSPNLAGKIKSIWVKNFVTYDECVMNPTEYLNIIIGPNGTGKSTLVAAIVLGMGGSAKLLARSSAIQEYIKNGKTEALISIKIYVNNQRETKKFVREFDSDGKSEFKINGVIVTHKAYMRCISEYNIQVDNLCQFLPQDRVQDFAKMNPQELLNNTISSVCEQPVIEKFDKLKELQKKKQNAKNSLIDDINRLNDLKHRNEGLKQILERMATKKKFAETINICNAKKLWIETKELKEKAAEIRSNLDDAEKIVKERQSRYNTLMKEQGKIIQQTADLANELQKQGAKCGEATTKIENIIASIEDLETKIRRAKQEIETKKKEQIERDKEIEKESMSLRKDKEELERVASSSGSTSERAAKREQVTERLSSLKVQISAQMAKRSEINKVLEEDYVAEITMLKNRIQSLESFKDQRLRLLEQRHPDQYKAVMWLRENSNQFQGRIYEPMILELNVPDPNHAKYFENTIAVRDLLAFTCEDKQDMSKLIDCLRIQQHLSISILYSPPAEQCQYRPNQHISSYSEYGFYAFLIDLLEGPPAILNYLCRNYNIQGILIGTEKVNDFIESLPSNLRHFYGGDVQYHVSISKYSNHPIRSQTRIQSRNFLSGVDRGELNKLKKRYGDKVRATDTLRNERAQIEAKTDELEHQRSEAMKELRSLEMVVHKLRDLKERLQRSVRRVKALKDSALDIPHFQELQREKTKLYVKEIIEFQETKAKCLIEYQRAVQEKECAAARSSIYRLENEDLNRAITEATDTLVQGKKLVETVKSSMDSAAKKYRLRLVEAKNLTNGLKPTDPNFPYTQQFTELPDDIDGLKDVINDTSARLECLGETDRNVTEEYERRNSQIEALTRTIEEAKSGDENLMHQIESVYNEWIPEINHIIEVLNENFGNFMKNMDYVGEILLAMKDQWDFESYGIQILVQYRSGVKLQALDRYVQSGGERAVAIANYTLSLQQLTHVPFRCVDEINQGMDPRNERKIFDMLVEETTRTGSSQYFFVTPKLLPNLNCNERMTVHIVFNGKFVKPKNAFDFNIA